MFKKIKVFLTVLLLLNFFSLVYAKENFFEKAQKKFDERKIEDSKFLFQRNIVFNPKDAKSYLYLAKIFNLENNQREEEKNLKTALLLEPDNEDAMYMLITVELKKSNYSKVREMTKNFSKICLKLCEKKKTITESLKNIEPKNES
tara:strand:+ start:106 stop:543 length:438 start_codon:yes stop_codon:yes gene_type:complete